MAATPSPPYTHRSARHSSTDAYHARSPDTGRHRTNYAQHYEPWPSDSGQPTHSPAMPLDVDHSIPSSRRTRNADTRNNTMAHQIDSLPSNIYAMDSQDGSDFSIGDYISTPEEYRPAVQDRRPSGRIIAEESSLGFAEDELEEDEPTGVRFAAASQIRASESMPMRGSTRRPDTGADSPTSHEDRRGRGMRYDKAPTPGVFGTRQRASSLDSQTSGVDDGPRHKPRRRDTPRYDYSTAAGDLFGDYQIGRPTEKIDYFSSKAEANPRGRFDRDIVSPGSGPVRIPETAHTREAAQTWNNGHIEPRDNNFTSTNRDSLAESTTTLVSTDSKAASKKSFGSFSIFHRKGKDSNEESPEKGKNKLRPSYKRLTTGKPTPLHTPPHL